MRGLKTDRTARVLISDHAFIQNLRRGNCEPGAEPFHRQLRSAAAFDELVTMIGWKHLDPASTAHAIDQRIGGGGPTRLTGRCRVQEHG